MEPLTTKSLGEACRVFLTLAYPDGVDTIPSNKRPYLEMAADRPIEDFLSPAPAALGVCQCLTRRGLNGYEFRLGSARYPHLKLRVQIVDSHGESLWVYSVDTHDGFHQATQFMSPEEALAWRELVDGNRQLKHDIEEDLARAGLLTPVLLLRIDLTPTA